MNPFDIFFVINELLRSGRAELFFDARSMRKSCVVNDIVLTFEEEEDGSITVRYQNLVLLWVRETPGWEEIVFALDRIAQDENSDSSGIRRRVFESLLRKLTDSLDSGT